MAKRWTVAPRTHDDLVAQLLANRGVDPAEAEKFLMPSWERDTFATEAFTQMARAVDRLFHALKAGERIVIHGDYDADGVSGASLLYLSFREIADKLGYPVNLTPFLPDRELDGYGVAMHTVDRLGSEGTKLIVTVDCGIANGLELGRAAELGIDTIVCDHHQLGQHYPEASIVLHPLSPGETYPNKVLCGTGVAFKFASACFIEARRRGAQFPDGYEKWFLDFVAVATVTDVMPLVGENRTLEFFGLQVLQKTRRPGLQAILELSGTDLKDVNTETIGFRIGPRLNAAGRLSSASKAFDVLTATTIEDARGKAVELEILNKERQKIFQSMYAEAKEIVVHETGPVIVAYAPHWAPGIVGLVAGRLVGDYGKPAFALTNVGDHVVGSGRSLGGLNLVEAMNACDDGIFVKRGGHPQACGLTLKSPDVIASFRDGVCAFAAEKFGADGPVDELKIDAELQPSLATLSLVNTLAALAPFGEGNRAPLFVARDLTVADAAPMGSTGAHLRLTVKDDVGLPAKFIGFGFGSQLTDCKIGRKVSVAYAVEKNVWNGRTEPQLRIVDIQFAS